MQIGETLLRTKAQRISIETLKQPKTQQLIDLMIATLRDRTGVGLAAPQVGEPLQIIIIEDKKIYHEKLSDELLQAQARKPVGLKILVNPVLTIEDDGHTNEFFEGCLSVDGYLAVTPRANKVKVSGLDRYGKEITFTAEGWYARILQHEVDHLHGILYVDRMVSRTFLTERHYVTKWAKTSLKKLTTFINTSR